MIQRNLLIFTRTPLHVGAGSSVGAIDQPIQRERHTGFPIIPGSSLKGVFRHVASCLDGNQLSGAQIDDLFGPEISAQSEQNPARAGSISFGEARTLAFPVRSAKGSFAFATCALALQRFARDLKKELPAPPQVADLECLSGPKVLLDNKKVVLEEYCYQHSGAFPAEWETLLKDLITDPVWKEAPGRLVLLSDGDFSHFVSTTTEISYHNQIDPRTGTVRDGALFNLESVPAETLFFAPVLFNDRTAAPNSAYSTDCASSLEAFSKRHPVMQFGGNSTTGRGFCSVQLL
jgi:CRISPR-associated protein Cmr4